MTVPTAKFNTGESVIVVPVHSPAFIATIMNMRYGTHLNTIHAWTGWIYLIPSIDFSSDYTDSAWAECALRKRPKGADLNFEQIKDYIRNSNSINAQDRLTTKETIK